MGCGSDDSGCGSDMDNNGDRSLSHSILRSRLGSEIYRHGGCRMIQQKCNILKEKIENVLQLLCDLEEGLDHIIAQTDHAEKSRGISLLFMKGWKKKFDLADPIRQTLREELREKHVLYEKEISIWDSVYDLSKDSQSMFDSRGRKRDPLGDFARDQHQRCRTVVMELTKHTETLSRVLRESPLPSREDQEWLERKMESYCDQVRNLLEVYRSFILECQKSVTLHTNCGNPQEVFMKAPSYSVQSSMSMASLPVEQPSHESLSLSDIELSAVAPRQLTCDEYAVVSVILYTEEYRRIVDQTIAQAVDSVQEKKGTPMQAALNARIRVVLSADGAEIEEEEQVQIWNKKYLMFDFLVIKKEEWEKSSIPFRGKVYINDVPASKISFVVKCSAEEKQVPQMKRQDVRSAFISYARKDIDRVALVLMGLLKARPELELFFDVESMQSGENWQKRIMSEIDTKDVLFLCWSANAKSSQWVEQEWRYALEKKGIDGIDPIPLDSPQSCPPPAELDEKHFHDKHLFLLGSAEPMAGAREEIVILESGSAKVHSWSQEYVIVGRGACDLRLNSNMMSRCHLMVRKKNERGLYVIEDMKTTNGSYLLSEKGKEKMEPEREYEVPAGTVVLLANVSIVLL